MRTFTVNGDRVELFVPLLKFDERTGEFEAWSTVDELDAHNEVCDVEKSWPALVRWSNEQAELSDGKSVGNLRIQHRRDSLGGKITLMELGEREGLAAVHVAGLITNSQAIKDAAEGVITGISIRGMADRWVDPNNELAPRYVWTEVEEKSLVDRPAVPHALIEVLKSNGSVEMIKAEGRQVVQLWDCGLENCDGKHVRKEEAAKCEGRLPTRVEAKKNDDTKKSLWRVGELASVISTLRCITSDSEWDEAWRAVEGKAGDPTIVASLNEISKKIFDVIEAILADERVAADLEAATETDALATGEIATSAAMRALARSPVAKQLLKSLRVPSGNGSNSLNQEGTMSEKKKEEAAAETTTATVDAKSTDAILAKLDEIGGRLGKIEQAQSAHGTAIAELQAAMPATAEAQKSATTKLDDVVAKVAEQTKNVDAIGETVKSLAEVIGNLPTVPKGTLRPVHKEGDATADTAKSDEPKPDPFSSNGGLVKRLA